MDRRWRDGTGPSGPSFSEPEFHKTPAVGRLRWGPRRNGASFLGVVFVTSVASLVTDGAFEAVSILVMAGVIYAIYFAVRALLAPANQPPLRQGPRRHRRSHPMHYDPPSGSSEPSEQDSGDAHPWWAQPMSDPEAALTLGVPMLTASVTAFVSIPGLWWAWAIIASTGPGIGYLLAVYQIEDYSQRHQ